MDAQNFDHSHHALKIRSLSSGVDVLSFEGKEQLSAPFRYDIQFTSSDKFIAPESVLMQDGDPGRYKDAKILFDYVAGDSGDTGEDTPAEE